MLWLALSYSDPAFGLVAFAAISCFPIYAPAIPQASYHSPEMSYSCVSAFTLAISFLRNSHPLSSPCLLSEWASGLPSKWNSRTMWSEPPSPLHLLCCFNTLLCVPCLLHCDVFCIMYASLLLLDPGSFRTVFYSLLYLQYLSWSLAFICN